MFVYCLNCPSKLVDYCGKFALEAGALATGLTLGGANAWNPVGWAIIAGVAVLTVVAIVPWDELTETTLDLSSTTASIETDYEKAISKAIAKTEAKVKQGSRKYEYWIAAYVEYGHGRGTYTATVPLSYKQAIWYVRAGGNVFAASQQAAYKLALAVGNGRKPTKVEQHKSMYGDTFGFWRHYHDGLRLGGHIFYV